MNIDEARFKLLEQNVQALQQTAYRILTALLDLKIVLAQKHVITHPEEKGDIPEHSLFAQVRRVLEADEEAAKAIRVVKTNWPTCLRSTACSCPSCESKRRRESCTGDYYGAL
jgi:hypothetical protein